LGWGIAQTVSTVDLHTELVNLIAKEICGPEELAIVSKVFVALIVKCGATNFAST
jgi:hypothetical protein